MSANRFKIAWGHMQIPEPPDWWFWVPSKSPPHRVLLKKPDKNTDAAQGGLFLINN